MPVELTCYSNPPLRFRGMNNENILVRPIVYPHDPACRFFVLSPGIQVSDENNPTRRCGICKYSQST